MGVWDDRYGNPGAPAYRGEPRNEPESFDVLSALRGVTTLKGVLAPASIDPRAIDSGATVTVLRQGKFDGEAVRFLFDVDAAATTVTWDEASGMWMQVGPPPVVASLPAAAVRFEGMAVRYRHTSGQPPWLCVWDSALNGGVGAWAVFGGAPLRTEESNVLNTSSTSYVDFFTTVAIPVGGVYVVEFGGLYHAADNGTYARISINGPGSAATDSDVLIRGGFATSWSSAAKTSRRTFNAAGNVRQYVRSQNGTYSVTATTRYVMVTPIELRP